MQLSYENGLLYGLLLGNGRLNLAFNSEMNIRRAFFPIDCHHDMFLKIGIYEKGRKYLKWFAFRDSELRDFILTNSNVELFVDALEPIIAFNVKHDRNIGILWGARINGTIRNNSCFFEDGIFYFNKRGVCFGLKGDVVDYSCGYNLEEQILEGYLDKQRFSMRDCMTAGVFSGSKFFMVAGESVNEVKKKMGLLPSYEELKRRTISFWREKTKHSGENNLMNMSKYILKILQDPNGGVIAAPEFDPDYRHCGGYGYCWPRDAAYVLKALIVLNLEEEAKRLLEFLAPLNPNGEFFQRYFLNGQQAPSWCEQIDQTGSFIWAVGEYWKKYGKLNEGIIRSVERSGHFLEKMFKAPFETTDLWEERKGTMAYSCAAAYKGLTEGHNIMKAHGKLHPQWIEMAKNLRTSFFEAYWDPTEKRFARSIDSHEEIKDSVADSSLIGLAVPFEIVEKNDPKMRGTIRFIEEKLELKGGIMRYEGDVYPYGNSAWNVCTAWLAWYYRECGHMDKAMKYIEMVEKSATKHFLLPEQVNDEHKPKWVLPLAWSHANYVIAKYG